MIELIKMLMTSNWGLLGLGIGLGVSAIVLAGKWLVKKLGPYWKKIEDMRDDVLQIKSQTNGRASMANTLVDHDRRICLMEQAQAETREDVREIKADVKDIYGMLNKRHADFLVAEERRGIPGPAEEGP